MLNKSENSTTIEEAYAYFNPVEILIVILFSIIFVSGTLGNFLAFCYFGLKKKVRKNEVTEFLLSVLAVVDFLGSVFNPLLYAYWTITRHQWHFGYLACKLLVPIGTIATTMSAGIYVIISLDRYRVVIYPLKKPFKFAYIKKSVLLVFVYAVIVNVHYSLNITIDKNNRCAPPEAKKAYSIPSIFVFLINVFVLLVVVLFTNYRVFSKIIENSPSSTLLNNAAIRKNENYKAIRLLILLTSMFYLFTLPRDILQFVFLTSWSFGKGLPVSKQMLRLNAFLKVLNVAHSCVNPVIYYRMNTGFKRFIRQSFCIKDNSQIRRSISELNTLQFQDSKFQDSKYQELKFQNSKFQDSKFQDSKF